MTDKDRIDTLLVMADMLDEGGQEAIALLARALAAGKQLEGGATLWIISAHTGEYSDSRDWNIAAYFDEEQAKRHVELATRRSQELQAQHKERYDIPDGANEYDPEMRIDYTGIDYTCYPLRVFAKPEDAALALRPEWEERTRKWREELDKRRAQPGGADQ